MFLHTSLNSNKVKNLTISNARQSPIFQYSVANFDYKKLNELPFERKKAIIEFLEKIQIKPLIAVIFDSTAKGTFNKDSDIDILLIYNKRESEDSKLKKDIEAATGVRIQPFIIDINYFKEQIIKEEDNVITHAIKTGFPITGNDKFYQEIL